MGTGAGGGTGCGGGWVPRVRVGIPGRPASLLVPAPGSLRRRGGGGGVRVPSRHPGPARLGSAGWRAPSLPVCACAWLCVRGWARSPRACVSAGAWGAAWCAGVWAPCMRGRAGLPAAGTGVLVSARVCLCLGRWSPAGLRACLQRARIGTCTRVCNRGWAYPCTWGQWGKPCVLVHLGGAHVLAHACASHVHPAGAGCRWLPLSHACTGLGVCSVRTHVHCASVHP